MTPSPKDFAATYWGNDNPPLELVRAFEAYRDALLESVISHFEADAKMCDCFARSSGECACGAWDDYKKYDADRIASEIRAMKEEA